MNQAEEFREIYLSKVNETIIKVVMTMIELFKKTEGVSIPEFTATHIEPLIEKLPNLDMRTGLFFEKMLIQIMEALQEYPFIIRSLTVKELDAGKFVTAAAWPHIQQLITELDEVSPTIINDVIASQ